MKPESTLYQYDLFLHKGTQHQLPINTVGDQHYLAFYRANQWWYEPISGKLNSDQSKKIQFILIENSNSDYTFILPINKNNQRLFLTVSKQLLFLSDQNNNDSATAQYVVVQSSNPYQCVKLAFSALRNNKPKPIPAKFWNHLGWCTWDAFYKEVSLEKIKSGLDTLNSVGHTPGWIVIDDGWQQYKAQLLTAKEPVTTKFLPSLKDNIEQIKANYNIKVGVWHAFLGYWAGFDPEGAWPKQWQFITNKIELWPDDIALTTTNILDIRSIGTAYADYHAYLHNEQVDFVKIDGQAFLEKALPSNQPLERFSKEYQTAITQSVTSSFSQQNIHCMAHEPYILQYATCAIWRNSDDYFPEVKDQGLHIKTNIFNNLWSQHIGTPDWDMFQTTHLHSEYHALARVISGGPIYISDIPGKHNTRLLERLTIEENKLLQPDSVAVPAKQSLFSAFEDRHELILVNNIANSCRVLGVFNCQNYGTPLSKWVETSDLPTISEGQALTVYSSRTKKASQISAGELFYVELPPQQAEILTLIPITEHFSFIGIIDKFLSIKTIENISTYQNTHKVDICCGGVFMFNYYGNMPFSIYYAGKEINYRLCSKNSYQVNIPNKGRLIVKTG